MLGDWNVSADVNLAYGGFFVKCDYQEFKWGYLNFVEVTDLDSACGARGMCLIEAGTVNGTDDHKRIMDGLRCVGMAPRDLLKLPDNRARMAAIAYALRAYGFTDIDRSEVVQTEEGAPNTYDGWKSEKFISADALLGYVTAEWID